MDPALPPASASAVVEAPLDEPTSIPALAALVPPEATLVAGVPGLRQLSIPLPDKSRAELIALLASAASGRLGLDEKILAQAGDALEEAVVFGVARRPGSFAVLARINDAALTGELVAKLKLRENGPDEWVGERVKLRRWTKAGVVLVATDPRLFDAAVKRAAARTPVAADTLVARASDAGRAAGNLWLVLDLATDAPKGATTTTLVASLGKDGLRIEDSSDGATIPRLGAVLAPGPANLMAHLPSGALFGTSLSVKRAPDHTFTDLVREISRTEGESGANIIDQFFERMLEDGLGLTSRDVESLLGDEIAFGVYLDPEPAKGRDLYSRIAVGVAADVGDEARIAAVLEKLQKSIKGAKSVGPTKSLVVDDKDKRFEARVEGRRLFVAFGAKKRSEALAKELASPNLTLATEAGWSAARKRAPAKAHAFVFADFAALAALIARSDAPTPRVVSLASITLAPREEGLSLTLLGFGGAEGALALADGVIAAVRDYLAASKTAEAKNTLGAIARGAVGAYERETLEVRNTHKLCGSSEPMPKEIPAGKKYVPVSEPGRDWNTGSDSAGWKCLKFEMTSPQYYRYEYRAGGGYKGPKRGGPDPGKDGFEVSAEGDLDGDGKTSLFTMTGKVDKKTQSIKLAPEIFVVDEKE